MQSAWLLRCCSLHLMLRRLCLTWMSLLLHRCPPRGCLSANRMRRMEGWRRWCRLAPWGKGISLFLLLMFFPSFEIPQNFCCREGGVRNREGSAVQWSSGISQRTVGMLGTVALTGNDLRERTIAMWDSVTNDVCVDKDTNYRDFFLTGVNLAAVPSTPEGSTPPMQHGIARALQLQRWRLLHQTSLVGFSVVSGLRKVVPENGSLEGGMGRRLQAMMMEGPSAGGGPDDRDYWGSNSPGPRPTPPHGKPDNGGDGGGDPEDPLRPPTWSLSLTDALYYYMPFLAGYITLMGLGIFALLLAIPMLALQLLLPRSQWSSTGVLVNMLCFPAAPFSTQKTLESGSVTRSRGKVVDTVTARAGGPAQDGVGSDAALYKGLSVLSEEAVTQSEAEVKATQGQKDLPQEQHASSETHDADAPATDSVAQATRTGSSVHMWTGQNAGLLLLVVLLFSVLMCVSLGFAYTAQIHQALHAVQCALTATVAQVFNGAGTSRQSVDTVLSKWIPVTLPPPDDLTDADYVPSSPEYITALRNLFKSANMSEAKIDELVNRFRGSEVEFNDSTVGGRPRNLLDSPRRLLAAAGDDWLHFKYNSAGTPEPTEPTEPDDAADLGRNLMQYLRTLFKVFRGGSSDAGKLAGGGEGPDQTSEDEESQKGDDDEDEEEEDEEEEDEEEEDEEEEEKSEPRGGRKRRLDFGGIVPLFQVLQRLSDVMNGDSPAGFSSVAATLFAKGLTVDHLLLSMYDHISTLEELIDVIPVSWSRTTRFDHVSLARMVALPFLQVINGMIPDLREVLRNGHVELRKATQALTSVEKHVFTGLEKVGGYEETLYSAGERIQQALNMVSWFRSDLLPPILYVVGAIVTFLLVGSVLYLMYLNRQSVKTWEGGEVHPGPSACLWWFLLVVGGAALIFGAALMTLGVITMDGCIFIATTMQNPQALEQVFPQARSSPSTPKLDDIISACAGRTKNRDLSVLLKIPAPNSSARPGHSFVSAKEIREQLHSQLETARIELDRLEKDQLIVDSITTITATLDLVYELAGIYLIRADVRSDLERTAPVAYYSGIQDETVEFWSIFDLPRAELIGPEGVEREDLLPLPLTPLQRFDLYEFYFARADHPLSAQMLTLLDSYVDIKEKMRAAATLLGDGTVRGRYRLYGLKDMRQEIRPLYFLVFAKDEGELPDPRLMVDNNSQQAREYTQRILGEMPQDQRIRIGEAVELARRKTAVRPGRSFTCVRRVGYTSEENRHTDKEYVKELTRVFKTMEPVDVDDYVPDWRTASGAFSTVGDARGRRREHVECTYEEHRAQLQSEAVQAVFAVASLHGRLMKSKEEIRKHLIGRADAIEDYVGALEDNVDCTPVYRSLLTTQHLVCRDVTERVTLLGITWLFTSLLAIALFIVFFSVWRYLTERYFRRQEAEKARLDALRAAEKAAEDARRAHEERVAREEAAAAAAAASAARAEARARQVSAAALNRQRTSVQRAQSASGARLQIHSGSFAPGGGVREMLAARDQGNSVEDTMWADTSFD